MPQGSAKYVCLTSTRAQKNMIYSKGMEMDLIGPVSVASLLPRNWRRS